MKNYVESLRELIGTQMLYLPGVRAIIINGGGEVLLQMRTDVGLWGLPSGSCELGETALETLQREVAEETALEVLEAEPMALYSGPGQSVQYPNGDRIQCFSVCFIVRKWKGTPKVDGVEGSELKFFPPDSLPENLVELHRRTLKDFTDHDGKFRLLE
ncbi:MAG: NUDIX domain-containing protein [Candidatus Glassbacteria bacterium]